MCHRRHVDKHAVTAHEVKLAIRKRQRVHAAANQLNRIQLHIMPPKAIPSDRFELLTKIEPGEISAPKLAEPNQKLSCVAAASVKDSLPLKEAIWQSNIRFLNHVQEATHCGLIGRDAHVLFVIDLASGFPDLFIVHNSKRFGHKSVNPSMANIGHRAEPPTSASDGWSGHTPGRL